MSRLDEIEGRANASWLVENGMGWDWDPAQEAEDVAALISMVRAAEGALETAHKPLLEGGYAEANHTRAALVLIRGTK